MSARLAGDQDQRTPILSVTIHDCEVQHFRSGGKGGQNQNKRDTGTRVIHHPSGARGESREERSQLQNKRAAFRRMVETPRFRAWLAIESGRSLLAAPPDPARYEATEQNVLVHVFVDGRWVLESDALSA